MILNSAMPSNISAIFYGPFHLSLIFSVLFHERHILVLSFVILSVSLLFYPYSIIGMVRDKETRSLRSLVLGFGCVIQYHQVLRKEELMSERRDSSLEGSSPPFSSPVYRGGLPKPRWGLTFLVLDLLLYLFGLYSFQTPYG